MFAKTLRYSFLLSTGFVLLSGCSPKEQTPVIEQTSQLYNCGALQVTTVHEADTLQLSFGEQEFQLTSAPSASGSRYVSAEHGAEFWSKGNEAQFSTDKLSLPLCVQQGTLPQQFNARGNEPFWLLKVEHQTAELRTPGKEKAFDIVTRTTLNDAPPYSFELSLDATTRLRIDEAICYDSMSGQTFPYTASLIQQDEAWAGCGGDPQSLLTGVSWKDSRATNNVATITFSPQSRVSGFAGCNFFTGNYIITGEGISFSPFAVTKQMCPPAAMDYEQQFLQKLTQVANFKVFADGTLHLQLRDGDYLQFSDYPLDLLAN